MNNITGAMPKIFGMFGVKTNDLLAGLLVVLVSILVYANSLGNGFVWDDTNVIVTNPALQGSPVALFSSIDTTRDYELLPYYRPLAMLTFLLEERVHGLIPWPMHFINVLLHAANAFLVFLLARTVLADTRGALLAGLLFAVHPINTEAVDFISTRNTILACFFILTAYLMHRRSIMQKNSIGAFAAAVFLLAGFFSKESALVALPFIIALEVPSLRDRVSGSRSRAALRLLPYAVAVSCYLVMRWLTLSRLGIQTGMVPGFGSQQLQSMYKFPDLWTRLADNLYSIPRYLLSLIGPIALSPRYVIPENLRPLALPLVSAWICISAIVGWLLTKGRSRATLFGLLWFAAFYLPVSGIALFPSSPMADRYLYVPAIGLWFVAADQATRFFPSGARVRRYGVVAVTTVLLVLSVLTIRRNLDWKNDVTLFVRLVEQYPDNAFGHAGLGEAYFMRNRQDAGELKLAEQEFEKSLALNPLIQGVHTKMGYIRLARGDSEGAVQSYTLALGIHPSDKEARLNRGIALENIGRQKEALNDFKLFLATPGYELADARPYAEGRIRELSK
ncbi:MAG: hypothetical protein A2X58_07300 [Nitrospirae bacterium GWC2_56_14]|nr:MAG: hypothetical protein A2X58_07300 [Nitrospirae bacterium GWC2_56_14]